MFIYKITVVPLNQVYIGFDTGPSYKLRRWHLHCQNATKGSKTKLYRAMAEYGIENCTVEVVEDNFKSIAALALAEVNYIKKYNSYKEGLNSTRGGDGLGRHNLHLLDEEELNSIKQALSEDLSEYNKTIKWANTTSEERKVLTSHLHTDEVYKKKAETLKKFYEHNPEVKKTKLDGIKVWREKNPDILKERNRANSLKAAEKTSSSMLVEKEDGTMLFFKSKSEFGRMTGEWAQTIIKKTADGSFYNGYRIKEINGKPV
jgi:group I intron endonuclease